MDSNNDTTPLVVSTYFLCALASISCFIIYFTFIIKKRHNPNRRLPPGPRPYPIIGNLLAIGSNPLWSLTHLAESYGPIMSLKLGATRTTIVISSPHLAEQALNKHDLALSDRAFPDGVRSLKHHQVSVAWIPVSPQWRALRRACAANIFSPQRLDFTQVLRHRKVQDLVDFCHECCNKGEAIDLAEAAFTTVLNSISNTIFSMDFGAFGESQKYKELVKGIVDEIGRPNIVDIFPILSILHPQGVRARMDVYYKKLYGIFDGIMEERLRQYVRDSEIMESRENNNGDVLDSFNEIVQDETSQLSRRHVLHLFMDLFVAGVDTTSSTLEWAMAELIRNPEKIMKLKTELRQILGENESNNLEESQISNFPYLQAVIKETLRLHPPAPFLLPHKANHDVELCGFLVPKNAQILVNVWAIGRDPSVWDNPNMFLPERFLGSEKDFKGRDFEFIPFGAGRRICPGLSLASRALAFMVASLVYHFDWKLPNGLKPEDMDMSQNYGITLHKTQPLRVIPMKVK